MSDESVISIVVAILLLVFLLLRMSRPAPVETLDPDKYIVVDGSNVMHWGGEPSVLVLNRILLALGDKGLSPIVFFDANVGYKLWGRHTDAAHIGPKIGVLPRFINVVPSGVVADEMLLEFAIENDLRVVTNDRFLDWRMQYPRAAEKGFLVKGTWREGTAMFRGL